MFVRRTLLGAAAICAIALPIAAQTPAPAGAPAKEAAAKAAAIKGIWVGFSNGQQGKQRVTVVFDSTGTDGAFGSMIVPQLGADSLGLDLVKIKGDSVNFAISVQGTNVVFRGARAGNWYNGEVLVQGMPFGTLQLAKAGTAEAAELLSSPMFLDDRRR